MRIKCAVDTETDNIDFYVANVVELSIVPLTNDFELDPQIKPLTVLVNPGEEELGRLDGGKALAFNKISRDTILKDGIPVDDINAFIEGWMFSYDITEIHPLAHNWIFDRCVLRKMMGHEKVEKTFYRRAMDSHCLSVAINDRYELFGQDKPFKQTRLTALAEYFGIKNDGAHRAEFDCVMTAQIYKKLLQFPVPLLES
jgi:DNA polymerase III epsilon subunit-like protein